MKSCIVFKTLI